MGSRRVALIFDNTIRPETTGVYCLRALKELVQVEHFFPQDLERIPRDEFDLYLNIDDGLRYHLPADLRPSAWWAIDTHMDAAWVEEKGRHFDWLFAAQRDGAERLTESGVPTKWVPLACDPAIHRPHPLPKCWDVCFIGRVSSGPRQELLRLVQEKFPNSLIGQRYFEDFAQAYSEARIGFNRSVKNDVNMRVFETLGCGTLLVTNDLRENGQEELFESGRHLVTYQGAEELLEKLRFYLSHDDLRERIAQAGHAEVVAKHTYRQRMQSILETIERSATSTFPSPALPVMETTEGRLRPADWLESIDFIIKTFLRPQALLRLLRSILEFYPQAHVTIADDGNLHESSDPESRACRELIGCNDQFVLHSMPFNAGVTPGRNLLVNKTRRPFLLLLDDDFCFTAETRVERFWERLQTDPEVGLVAGACIDVTENDRRPRNSGGTLEIQGDTLLIDTAGWSDRQAALRDYVPQFALIRREVFEDVRWEGGIGGEHYDFCLQLQKSQWKVAHDVSVLVDHYHFTPALPGYVERRFDCAAAQQWLLRKWNLARIVQDRQTIIERDDSSNSNHTSAQQPNGQPTKSVSLNGKSDNGAHRNGDTASHPSMRQLPVKDTSYFEHARPEVVALIPATARRVLDIGCGRGRLGGLLKERQSAEVVGIELQPDAATVARKQLDQVIEQTVEDPSLDFAEARFDCIVCADVLEHLREPALVLAKIRRWLTPEGVLVVSLPNVRHHTVVASLLEGNWTYESAGLLDSDHVRFFTRREIEKLLYRQGFEIESLHAKPGPGYDEWHKAGRPGNVRVGSLNIGGLTSEDAEEFFTYQYLVVARPGSAQPTAADGIQKLAARHPWPAVKPNVAIPTEKLGWFKESPRELMRRELTSNTKLVVELGAWLGLSTRFIADQAPQARVITIDHFEGSSEHRDDPTCAAMLPTLFDTFTAMNWEYRERILPLKMTTREGLQTIFAFGLSPDVIFIDADHAYASVAAELALCRELFPAARIVGDDYDHPDVQQAVDEYATRLGLVVEPVGTGWRSWRLLLAPNSVSHSELPIPRLPIAGLTSIVIVTYNQLAYTKECVDSIRLRTDEPYELIFVDNGSGDGTPEYLRSLHGTSLTENHENRGFPAAVNQGLQIARGEYVVLLNNDTVVTTGWLRRMQDVMAGNPRIGLVGPCSNNVGGSQIIPTTYRDMSSLDGFAWERGKRYDRVVEETTRLIGFCLLVRRAVFDQIGFLDERFGIGCFEDDDLCLRALRAGWKAVIARAAFVHHYGNRTFQGSGVDLQAILQVNRQKFLEKWNGATSGPGRIADLGIRRSRLNGSTSNPGTDNPLRTPNHAVRPVGSPMDRVASPVLPALPSPNQAATPRFDLTRSPTGGLLLTPNAPKLSLCMIVRDNETTIGPCLESIRPFVDEIVVVDTGSNDKTPNICRNYGARMFTFPWCDDFSAARNESLRNARGEWLFWMDSDDTISAECGRKLRELVDSPHAENTLGYVMQVRCPGPGSDGENDVTVVDHLKLLRNRPDLRFEGRIHEQLLPAIRRAGGEVAWTDICVMHSGSDHSPVGRERKLERDLRILHQELSEKPDHPFVLFNLGMTYADARHFDEAIRFLAQCVNVSRPEESHLRKAFALFASSLGQVDRHEDAWQVCQHGLALYPADKELLFRCAMLHHHFGRLKDAEATYLRIFSEYEPRHFTSVDVGLAGHKARHNLAVVYEDMGVLEKAEEQWRLVLDAVPEFRPAWCGLAGIAWKKGGRASVDSLIATMSTNQPAARNTIRLIRAEILEKEGHAHAAKCELELAIEEAPHDLDPLKQLCRILFEHDAPQSAEVALRRLMIRCPEDGGTPCNLGIVLMRAHRYREAITCFERSLELEPNLQSARHLLQQCRSLIPLDSTPPTNAVDIDRALPPAVEQEESLSFPNHEDDAYSNSDHVVELASR